MTLNAPELVGRTAVLETVLRRAAARRSTVLTGPTGIGRSRLLQEAAARLERDGKRAVRIAATASAATVPYGVFLGLLDRRTVLQIGAADALGRASMLRAGVLALDLDVLLVDEASLLDPGSAAFLLELARGGTAVVVATTAGRRVPDAIRTLVEDGVARSVRLDPLDPAACAVLAAAVLGGPADSALGPVLREITDGLPAAVTEVLREGARTGTIVLADGLWRQRGDLAAPAATRRLAGSRFLEESPEAQDWLCAVAVAGAIADDVSEVLCTDAVADRAERIGWTVHDALAGTTRMRRRVQAEGVLESVGSRQRRSTVRRLLAAVDGIGRALTDHERIARGAWRLELGEPIEVEEAMELASLTALTDPALCERLLRHAIARGGGAPAEVALAEQLKRTGRFDEAERLLGAQPVPNGNGNGHRPSPDDVARVLAYLTGFGARRGAQALAALDEHMLAHGEHADLLAVRGGLLWTEMRYREALPAVERLRRETAGFPAVFAGMQEALIRTELGDAWGALDVVDALRVPARHVVDRIPEAPMIIEWLTARVPATVCLDLRSADPIADRNNARLLESGMHAVRAPFAHLLGTIRMLQGDLDSAVQLLREAEGLPGILRDSHLPLIVADLSSALTLSGDLRGAAAALQRAVDGGVSAAQQGRVRLAEAELRAAEGDSEGAAALARAVAERAREHDARVEEWDALFAALRYGDTSAAEGLVALAPLPGVARVVQQEHAAAVLAEDVTALEPVARRYRTAGLRLYAMETVAETIRRQEAMGLSTAAAAERLASWRAEAPSLRATADTPSTGLTAREREVVRLAARGLPDRAVAEHLGISVRTAQTHLSRAFNKLGVHRRSELAALLRESD